MRNVTYTSILTGREGAGAVPGAGRDIFVPLEDDAIVTRRKDARRELAVGLSKDQERWLRRSAELAGRGIDEAAIVRALVDLGRALELDWPVLAGGDSLRAAVRESVLVRRGAGGAR